MKIGLVQAQFQPGLVSDNVAAITEYIAEAAAQECNLVVLPEMCDTGYDMNLIARCAVTWDSPEFYRIADAASSAQIAVVCGLAEREAGQIYNTIAVIGADGQLVTKYRKVHLINVAPIFEPRTIAAGQDLCLFEHQGFHCGVMTCYDIRFPEMARALTLQGAQVIFVPAAFPASRISHWQTLNAARAIENQAYVVGCNRVGTDAGVEFGGHSMVVSPLGQVSEQLSHTRPGLTTLELDHTVVVTTRDAMRVLDDRRADVYARWQSEL